MSGNTQHSAPLDLAHIDAHNRTIAIANVIIRQLEECGAFHSAKEGLYGVEITRKQPQFGGGYSLCTQIIPWEESK